MKKVFNSLLYVSVLSMLLLVSTGSKTQAQDVSVSYQTFYDELSPYGQWVYDPEYGNVWVPNEDGDFRPYGSRGQWVMTDYGNTWVSDDPWGWACYHYGRWTYNGYYGWIWVPGYEWAPAWVSWRYGGGYAGWAPLAPGYGVGSSYGCPDSWWVFVGPQYLYRHDYYNYWRGPSYNRGYINQTTIINNVYVDNRSHVQYNYGPRASTIQATTHAPVQVYRVSNSTRPGSSAIQQRTVSMYRPNVDRGTYTTARPGNVVQAPRNIGRPEAATPTTGRQPAFRQEIQRNNPGNTGVVGPRNNNNYTPNQQPGRNNPQQANPGGRNDRNPEPRNPQQGPGRFDQRNPQQTRQEPQRNPEPVRQNPQVQPQQPQRFDPQPQRNPEPVRQNPQVQPQQPQRFEPQQPRPEPQHFTPQRNPEPQQPQRAPEPQRNPEPQRYNPPPQQPQRNPEPQRYNPPPQPQRAPEQPRPQPQLQPQMQQPRPQPAPAPAPRPQQAPQEQRGGGRR